MKWLALVLIVVVLVLHQDYWNFNRADLVFGFLPIGLAYHGAYSIGCAVLMWILVRLIWPRELEKYENVTTPTAGSHAQRNENGGH